MWLNWLSRAKEKTSRKALSTATLLFTHSCKSPMTSLAPFCIFAETSLMGHFQRAVSHISLLNIQKRLPHLEITSLVSVEFLLYFYHPFSRSDGQQSDPRNDRTPLSIKTTTQRPSRSSKMQSTAGDTAKTIWAPTHHHQAQSVGKYSNRDWMTLTLIHCDITILVYLNTFAFRSTQESLFLLRIWQHMING